MDELSQGLTDAMAQIDEDQVLLISHRLSEQGVGYHEILGCLNEGMKLVGERFESGEYFIGDLIVSGMIYRAAISLFTPENSSIAGSPAGRVVIGVVEHDIHDIGKDIVTEILRADSFEVIDLGVDVKPERFVYAVQTYNPDVLLMSGMLRLAQSSMEVTMRKLADAGLRDNVAVLIGGGCVTRTLQKQVGADASAGDPMVTLQFCKDTISGSPIED